MASVAKTPCRPKYFVSLGVQLKVRVKFEPVGVVSVVRAKISY